jgi:hypothetical protein
MRFEQIVVGYPAPDCWVPVLAKKSHDEVMIVT